MGDPVSGGFTHTAFPRSVEEIPTWAGLFCTEVCATREATKMSSCPLQTEACFVLQMLICLLSLKVVLVTDGCLGIGRGSLRHSLATHNQRSESNRFPLPFPFPSKLYVMCMANLEEVMSLTCTFSFVALGNWVFLPWTNDQVSKKHILMFLCLVLRFSWCSGAQCYLFIEV